MSLKWRMLVILISAISKCESAQNSSVCFGMSECMVTASCDARHRDANSDALWTRPVLTCGDKDDDTVCCPAVDTPERDSRTLLPDDCGGLDVGDRIVDGKATELGELPWMALIGIKTNNNTGILYHCGGSVINSRYVLTAAHCVGHPHSVVQVRLAEYDLRNFTDIQQIDLNTYEESNTTDIRASRITQHPDYNSTTLKNDIALVRLKTDIAFSKYIQPICLPFGVSDNMVKDGKNYKVAGWGLTGASSPRSDVLLKSTVKSFPDEECNYLAKERQIQHIVDGTQLRTTNYENGPSRGISCAGDSGGPLMGVVNKKNVVVGIVSLGFGNCDDQNTASIYTRVHPYLDWILQNIDK